jgi:hypothetical protein
VWGLEQTPTKSEGGGLEPTPSKGGGGGLEPTKGEGGECHWSRFQRMVKD